MRVISAILCTFMVSTLSCHQIRGKREYVDSGSSESGSIDSEPSNEDDSGVADIPRSPTYPGFEWIVIPGGTFIMGGPEESAWTTERPPHEVTIRSFRMLKTEVTVEQYASCVHANACAEPKQNSFRNNWGKPGREKHPINGVDWYQARRFGAWAGARLPSEAEWEYAARGAGQNIEYPWGDEEPSCEYSTNSSCDLETTMEVCSKPLGDTAQGLSDMGGNVSEWVEDKWHDNYDNAPSDGSPWMDDPSSDAPVYRGCDIVTFPQGCRCRMRQTEPPTASPEIGFRIVQDFD